MRNFMKNKKLLTALAISCLSFGAAAVLSVAPQTAFADTTTDALITALKSGTEAAADEFYMDKGASVRVDTSGIRFATYVTPAYHAELEQQGDVTYYAIAKAVDGTVEQVKEIPFTTALNKDGNYTLYTYINFQNAESTMTDANLNALYAQEFTTSTYAMVKPTEGNPIYYQANDGDGVVRSMRAVGNEAWLNWTEASKYEQSDLVKYFTESKRSTEITAYALDTEKVAFQMPEYTCTTESVTAYVGAEKYTATYDKNSNSFTIADCTATSENLSVFGSDGTVYSTKMAEGIEINNTTIDTIRTATGGNLVLTEDINMAGKSWTEGTGFAGTIDGIGHKINNFSSMAWMQTFPQDAYMSLIHHADAGATIKNVDIHLKTNGWRSGLIGQVKGATTIDNVNIICDSLNAYYGGTIANVIQGTLTVKDTSIVVKATTPNTGSEANIKATTYSGIIAGGEAPSNNVVVSNVICYNPTEYATTLYNPVTSGYGTFGADGKTAAVAGEDYVLYTSQDELLAAYEQGKISDEFMSNAGLVVTSIDESNIDVLQTATSGYYILTNDVDLEKITWAPTATFSGTLNGNGYKISNLTGSLFKTVDGAKIKNLILDNVTMNSNGIISNSNLDKDVTLNNVIVKAGSISGGNRTSLFGYQLGGTATLKNVIVDMPKYISDLKGLVTSYAGKTVILENVYCMGANGTLHSNSAEHSTTSFVKADGETAAQSGTDYFVYEDCAAFKEAGTVIANDAMFKSMVKKYYNIDS